VLESVDFVADSLVVDLEGLGGASYLVAFVVLEGDRALDDASVRVLRDRLRRDLSPRHVPDEFLQVGAVPRTLNGKKLEVPLKRVLLGEALDATLSRDAVSNPEALDEYVGLAEQVRTRAAAAGA
jgi:acetoacetyl-CoA synthetase